MALFTDCKTAAPDKYNPPPELAEGARAVKESVDMGAITEEEGNALIAHLYSEWMGAAVTNMVIDHLGRGVEPALANVVPTESESVKAHEESASRRKYQFAYYSAGLAAAVGVTVLFALTDNRDMMIPIVTAAAGFLGGFAARRVFATRAR